MPKKLNNALTSLAVKSAKPGRHADGGGLHLLVKESGARSWVYRFMLKGKARDVGLGAASGPEAISLATARDKASALRLKVKAGVDPLAERARKIGQPTLRSIGNIAKLSRIKDNDAGFVSPADMLDELVKDNKAFTSYLRAAHEVADEHNDSATTSVLEVYIDEAERRTWFLFEASRGADASGH